MGGEKGILFYKFGRHATAALLIAAGSLLAPFSIQAASLKVNLEFDVKYNYTSNMDSVDPSLMVPTKAQWLDLLVGGGFNYRARKVEVGAKGNVGYSDYLSAQGGLEKINRIPIYNYNYFRATAGGWARFVGRILTVELTDDLIRTRSLADLYGPQTDALNDRFLYTDNVASVGLKIKATPKVRLLLKYSYETIEFPKPENPDLALFQPPNSIENRGYVRGEYDFNRKNTVFLDLQGGERIFLTRTISGINMQFADYNFFQGLAGYHHRFNERSNIEVMGGANNRHFFHEAGVDLKDYTAPLARVTYNRTKPQKYDLHLLSEWGTSTYGANIFFDYLNAQGAFKYYFTRKFNAQANAIYTRDMFSAARNDRTALWKPSSRIDNLYQGSVALEWDPILKNNETVLALRAGYQHTTRDSNLDDPNDFKTPLWTSYDTSIEAYFAEIQFLPMILIGK